MKIAQADSDDHQPDVGGGISEVIE